MKTSLFLRLFTILFLFCDQNNHFALSAHDDPHHTTINSNNKNKKQRQRRLNGGGNSSIHCVDLADFFYEIILSVSAFPPQGDCTDQEDAQIASVLQKSINTELRAIPGTINTKNKVCDNPINDRRSLSDTHESFSHDEHQYSKAKVKLNTTTADMNMTMNKASVEDERILLLRHGKRSFIYVGGGRCRFCFYDDYDNRFLSGRLSTKGSRFSTNNINTKYRRRSLLFFNELTDKKWPIPEVSDILLCKQHKTRSIYFAKQKDIPTTYLDSIKWTNGKRMTLPVIIHKDLFGLYAPGEGFGAQLDMNRAIALENRRFKEKYDKEEGQRSPSQQLSELPVKEGSIHFWLYSFDLPTDLSAEKLFGDLIIFINGIKLDMSILISEPDTVKLDSPIAFDHMYGYSFAGIRWHIMYHPNKNIAYGPQPDNKAHFQIRAPLIVFDHKNLVDIDFMIKPGAKAKHYAIGNFHIGFRGVLCKVTGMENSPFQDFQSVVESRLFHRLGVDLAHEFQSKQGHCLENKIPVVNVHLVEKETWKDSNPQCS